MGSVAEAFVSIRPDVDGFGGELKSKMGKFAGVASKALLGVGAAAGGAAAAGLKAFAGLQSGMNEVFTLLPGISQDAMSDMTGQVKEFSKEFGTLPNDVIPALYSSLSAGVPQDNVFEFLETANKAAVAGVTDLDSAVSALSSVTNSYGQEVLNTEEAADLMFTAVKGGVTTFPELGASLSNVTPLAAALGVQFGDVTASIVAMTKQGEGTAESTTKLRALFGELSKAGGKTAQMFESVAGESFAEFIEAGGDVEGAMHVMQRAADENGVAIQDLFGSVEAAGAAMMLTSDQGAAALSDALAANADAAGAVGGAFSTMDQGIGRSFEKIKAQGAVLLADLGEKLAPAFQAFADWLITNMPAISDTVGQVFQKIGEGARFVADTFGPVIAAITAVVERFRSSKDEITSSTAGLVSSLLGYWKQIQGIVKSATDAISAIVSVFTNVVQGFWERFGTHIISYLVTSWNNIKQIFEGAFRAIQGVFEVFAGIFTGDWSRFWGGIQQIVSGLWSAIHGILRQAVNVVSTIIGAMMAAVSQLWSAGWNALKSFLDATLGGLFRTLDSWGDSVGDWFRTLPGRILSALGDLSGLLVGAGRDILNGLWRGLKQKWTDVKGWVGGLGAKIKNLKGPIEVDRKLLTDEGAAIIDGLGRGMAEQFEPLRRMISGFADEIPDLVALEEPIRMGGVTGGDGASVAAMAADIRDIRDALRSGGAMRAYVVAHDLREGLLEAERGL